MMPPMIQMQGLYLYSASSISKGAAARSNPQWKEHGDSRRSQQSAGASTESH